MLHGEQVMYWLQLKDIQPTGDGALRREGHLFFPSRISVSIQIFRAERSLGLLRLLSQEDVPASCQVN